MDTILDETILGKPVHVVDKPTGDLGHIIWQPLADAMRDWQRVETHILLDALIRHQDYSITVNCNTDGTKKMTIEVKGPKKADETPDVILKNNL